MYKKYDENITSLNKDEDCTEIIYNNVITQKISNDNLLNKNSKIYIAGHKGLVGSSILKNLQKKGYKNLIYKTHQELDLINQKDVEDFFITYKPDFVILAAAKVGGVEANNSYRADFIYENLQIQNNIIHQSYKNAVTKLLFLGSSCIYPKNAPQPLSEDRLLTSELEYTNEPYAIAKIAGIKMCESYNVQYNTNFICAMPTNLYGENDNFDLKNSHVLPALIRKIHLAKLLSNKNYDEVVQDLKSKNIDTARSYLKEFGVDENSVEIWGSGKPRREFLYSGDMADACIFLLENINFVDLLDKNDNQIKNRHINIGTQIDISIKDLAYLIKDIVGFDGELYFNSTKLDGTIVKLTNCEKIHNLGWEHKTNLEDGIKHIYNWYLKQDNI